MTGRCELDVRFHQPPADLAPFFTTFCYGVVNVTQGDAVEDAMLPEWGALRFFPRAAPTVTSGDTPILSGARFVASGPTSRSLDYSIGSTHFWGIGMLPLGWATFMALPADAMADRIVDGEMDACLVEFGPLAQILLNEERGEAADLAAIIAFFRKILPHCPASDDRIVRIHQTLLDPMVTDVRSMADACGLEPRTLARLCRRAFGFPPKTLLRRQRFMRSLSAFMLAPDANWSDTIDGLYYDQSHFVRECHEFLGVAPSDYAARDLPILSTFLRHRAQVKGSPVQTLDRPTSRTEG